jgi:hypothetical protein
MAASLALGLAFMCNESALLVGLAWLAALLRQPGWRRGLPPSAWLLAAAGGTVVVLPDLLYNATATSPDYLYVNYRDHLLRIARPGVSLQGIGFFLRDAFDQLAASAPSLWVNQRCEYPGPGLLQGGLLLGGWLRSLRRNGDPTGGIWSWPPTALILVTTFARPAVATLLDPPAWTWPAPALPLVCAGAAALILRLGRHALWLLPLLLAQAFHPTFFAPALCN